MPPNSAEHKAVEKRESAEDAAATLLQASWKGRKARQNFHQVRAVKRKAALRMQHTWREAAAQRAIEETRRARERQERAEAAARMRQQKVLQRNGGKRWGIPSGETPVRHLQSTAANAGSKAELQGKCHAASSAGVASQHTAAVCDIPASRSPHSDEVQGDGTAMERAVRISHSPSLIVRHRTPMLKADAMPVLDKGFAEAGHVPHGQRRASGARRIQKVGLTGAHAQKAARLAKLEDGWCGSWDGDQLHRFGYIP